MQIVITGTPGTGKTFVSKLLAKRLKADLVCDYDFAKKNKCLDGDKVKLRKFENYFKKQFSKKNFIAEGHIFSEVKIPTSKVFVLRLEPKKLLGRLKKKGYGEKKIKNNLMVEILDYCYIMACKNYGKNKVWQIDTTGKSIKEVVDSIIKSLKKPKETKINWNLEKNLDLVERLK
jgi:adenylate kinase